MINVVLFICTNLANRQLANTFVDHLPPAVHTEIGHKTKYMLCLRDTATWQSNLFPQEVSLQEVLTAKVLPAHILVVEIVFGADPRTY